MNSDLDDLYQELILDHNRSPRNRGRLAVANCAAQGYNPLCGDRISLQLVVEGERVTDVAFEGSGCAISTASASLMTEAIKGKSVEEARALFNEFHAIITGGQSGRPGGPSLGKLEVFSGVGEFPARVKCATLAWHTLSAALDNRKEPVSTE